MNKTRTVLAGGALLLLAATQAYAADAPTKINIAQTSNGLGFSAMSIAQDEGFFAKNGIDPTVEVVSHGDATTLAAVHSGGSQFGAMTLLPAIQVMARGEKLEIVAPFVRQFVIQFVMSPKAAKKIGLTPQMPLKERMLKAKGMTVGTLDIGGGLQILFDALAKQYGMNPNSAFTMTAINSYPSLLLAAKTGQIDIALTAIPFGRVGVRKDGLAMLADFWGGAVPQYNGAVFQGLVVEKDYAASHPKVVAAMNRAIGEANAFIHSNPDKAVADLDKRYPKLGADLIRSFIVGDASSFVANGIVDRKGLAVTRDFIATNTVPQAAKLTYEDMVAPVARQKP